MKFYMKTFFLLLVALCTTTVPAGHARPLTINDLCGTTSPEQLSASVSKSSAEDVLSVSSVLKESSGDVSVSSALETSPLIHVPKASPEANRGHVSITSAEPNPGHIMSQSPPLSIASEEPSPGHVSVDSVPDTVLVNEPDWPRHSIVSEEPSTVSEEPSTSHGHVSTASVNWPPSLILN